MSVDFRGQKEKNLIALLLVLGFSCFLTYCFQFIPEKSTFLANQFFGPIILVSLWHRRRIWLAPFFLAAIFVFIEIFSQRFGYLLPEDYFRLIMFIFIVIVVAFLGERIEKVRMLNDLNEKLKKQTERLEDANNELEAFAYSVSHDLRVPLRAIDGFSRILLEDYGDKLDDEGKRLIDIVRDNTMKMGQLIDDILLLSRAGRQEMKISEIDVEALANSVFEELKHSMEDRNVQLEIKPLPTAYGDRTLLQQVFSNLLSNSVKFTRTKENAIIEVGADGVKNENVYYVKDNGVGFDMKYVNKLFGLFQRLHTPDEFEGTGVGLSIVQRIIRRHGGNVWGEGKVDEGATIYFTLPGKKEDLKNHLS
ncbi:MAG: two-component sensor histidine kinase [Euryarchaeota archaeon]|nr:two-component sensor histidine kinase [Euryarchaeota archaeon]